MAGSTEHYGFVKPEENEYYDINVDNGNMDKLDAALHGLDVSLGEAAQEDTLQAVKTDVAAVKADTAAIKTDTGTLTSRLTAARAGYMDRIPSMQAGMLGAIRGREVFISSGTFTVPAEVTKIYITACGGGGNSSPSASQPSLGGGGGDCIFYKPYDVTPGAAISITVGGPEQPTVIGSLVTLSPGVGRNPGGAGGGEGGQGVSGATSRRGLIGSGGGGPSGGGGSLGGGGGSATSGAGVMGGVGFLGASGNPGAQTQSGRGGDGAWGGGAGGTNSGNTSSLGGAGVVFIDW